MRVCEPFAFQKGRASGQAHDLRRDFPVPPYGALDVRVASHTRGDVAARVSLRFEEIAESARLLRLLLEHLPAGDARVPCAAPAPGARGCGWVESWRGDVFIALDMGTDGRPHRVHARDCSWQNWPLVERAVLGNIVPDFPLINKSFNLSYSGHDL